MVFINYIVTPEQRFVKRGRKMKRQKYPDILTAAQAAAFLRVGRSTIYQLIARRRTGEHSGTRASPDSGKVGAKVYEKDFRKGLVKKRNLWYHHTPNPCGEQFSGEPRWLSGRKESCFPGRRGKGRCLVLERERTASSPVSAEMMTMEEFYRLLHISKRRAVWILQAGLVPCEDRGAAPGGTGFPGRRHCLFRKSSRLTPSGIPRRRGVFPPPPENRKDLYLVCAGRNWLRRLPSVGAPFRSCWTAPGFLPVRDMPAPLSAAGCGPESFPPAGSGEGLRSPNVT